MIHFRCEGRITRANDAFLAITGRTRAELERGELDASAIEASPESQALDREMMRRLAATGSHPPYEKELVRPDGSRVPVLVASACLSDRTAFSVVVDLTAVKRAEVSLGEALAREKEARELAEEANRAKDDFLVKLGHELRNPLAPLHTALALLERKVGSSRELAIMERQLAHLTHLADDLREVSRMTRARAPLRKRHLALRGVVVRATEIVAQTLPGKEHAVVLDLAEELSVDGDLEQLAQVFASLLSIASRAADGSAEVHVEARGRDRDVLVRIHDGLHVPKGIVPPALEALPESPGERRRRGPGLGIPFVEDVLRMHGGELRVENAGTAESAFVVRLPAAEPATHATAHPGAEPAGERRRRVLIVDDNEDAADLLAEILRAQGHDVRTAHDGPHALSIVETFAPEVAVLDIGLPVMDGYELAARLRSRLGPNLRTIAVTGYGQESDRARSSHAGFVGHFVKPIDPADLERSIVAP